VIKEYFLIDKMQFGQAIDMNELRYQILGVTGVIGIQTLELSQDINDNTFKSKGVDGQVTSPSRDGYGFVYDFNTALQNGIYRPSTTPAVFELRNPNQDIYGRVL